MKREIIDINGGNVEREGFFCFMSKRKNPGWRAKLEWLKQRFPEGLRLKLLKLPERGFIEYIPGERCWRSVEAKGWMVIHCLWVVGRSRGKGNATALLDECLGDARRSGMKGVAMVVSGSGYMRWKPFLVKNGFQAVDTAPPDYELMARRFGKAPWPRFSGGWDRKAEACGRGIAILKTRQCPYFDDATASLLEAAGARGLGAKVVDLKTPQDVRKKAPTPFGTYSVVIDGEAVPIYFDAREAIERHGGIKGPRRGK